MAPIAKVSGFYGNLSRQRFKLGDEAVSKGALNDDVQTGALLCHTVIIDPPRSLATWHPCTHVESSLVPRSAVS